MNTLSSLTLSVLASVLLGIGLIAIAIWAAGQWNLPDNVLVALIVAAAGSISIMSSVMVVVYSLYENAKQQRALEVRSTRHHRFNDFFEALTRKLAFDKVEGDGSKEEYEAQLQLCIEYNRLPLYVSEALIKELGPYILGKADLQVGRLYSLVRDDLSNDNYRPFSDLTEFILKVPNPPARRQMPR